ncbi:MAG: hypothetical protein KA206_03985 [Paludibacter sp.]|nr:hypothetical protein [Paludibacter sp.]
MKTKNLLLMLLFSVLLFTNCFAQKESKKNKKEKSEAVATEVTAPVTPIESATPVVTEECTVNISLFVESAKNKQYADALAPWNAVYKDCPAANRVIYSRGREIITWEIQQAKDPVAYQQAFDKLMQMHDNRIKYFGDDAKYPTPYILGIKALDYVQFVKNDDLKKPAYAMFDKSVEGMADVDVENVRWFVILSNGIYKADATHAEKYINDFTKACALLDKVIAQPEHKSNAAAVQVKAAIEQQFAQSGAADCNTLDKMYKERVAQNLTNKDVLTNIVSLFKRVRCVDSEVFFSAAVALHKIEPSSESAAAIASMSYKKGEFDKAISFNDEATRLSKSNEEKADFQFTNAQIVYKELRSFSRARDYARKSLDYKPNNGKAYLLIGSMYASTKGIFSEPVLNKTVFWAAVDKFQRAKQVDPSVSADANELIRTYSAYFPSKDDTFFKPELSPGKSFFVAGWIGETTTCR